ncbi:MAG: hypothetical protein ACE5RQ_04185 [Nitrosopumilus sp.]
MIRFREMFKARKRRALSSVVTGAILLSAVSIMGLMIVTWANSNLQTHQAELDQTFADNHNKINERILVEHVWFGNTGPSINMTISNTGTLGLNVTEIKIQNIDSGQIYTYSKSGGGIIKGGEMSFNETLSWVADTAYEISFFTDRGNIFKSEVLSP